jgi:acyl-CoA thioester hydrolase
MSEAEVDPTFPHVIELTVRFGDLDALGHLNNVAALRMFETGRVEHSLDLGIMDGPRTPFVLAALDVAFRAQAFHRDVLAIATRVARIGRTSFTLDQRLYRVDDDRTIVRGESVLVVVGEDGATPAPVPDAWRALLLPDGT